MDQNGELLDAIFFEDEDEENAGIESDDDFKNRRLRLTAFNMIRKVTFNQKNDKKKTPKLIDGEVRFIISVDITKN